MAQRGEEIRTVKGLLTFTHFLKYTLLTVRQTCRKHQWRLITSGMSTFQAPTPDLL